MSAADWMHTYRETLGRLAGFRDHGNGRGRAACPIHGDGPEGADLWLAVGDQGRLILRCYPRRSDTPCCRTDDVMRAVGLDLSYLFPDNPSTRKNAKPAPAKVPIQPGGGVARKKEEKAVTEAVFVYEDVGADGKWFPSFEVVKKRYSDGGKNFPQRRPNPDFNPKQPDGPNNPKYLYDVAGKCRRVLYRLRELRAALREAPTRWVFVVEGETDVETLREIGFTATSSPGGSLKWTEDSFSHELAKCNVVVIADEDPVKPPGGKLDAPADQWYSPGIEHAKQVIRGILPFAKCVKWLRLPTAEQPGWDFSDWKRRQKGPASAIREQVIAMVGQAQWIKTVEELDAYQPLAFAGAPVPKGPTPSLPEMAPEPAAAPEPAPVASQAPAATPLAITAGDSRPAVVPGVSRSVEEAIQQLGALLALGGGPRTDDEWMTLVSRNYGRLMAAMVAHPLNVAETREAAAVLMAQIARGVDLFA